MLTIFVSFLTVSFFESVNIFVTGGYYIKALDGRDLLSTFKVDAVRGDSWAGGLKLFFENPLFGGGLGSNMKQTGLVIHSVWLWILAEMGLVGIFLFIPITFNGLIYYTVNKHRLVLMNREAYLCIIYLIYYTHINMTYPI